MKIKAFLISAMVIALFITLASCDDPQPKTDIISTSNVVPAKPLKAFPTKQSLQSINSSILKLSCDEYSGDGRTKSSWSGHCCLYSNNGDYSYLALPTHCFPGDSTKYYDIQVTDFKGKITKVSWRSRVHSTLYDAEILVVDRIKGIPTLCETGMIAEQAITGDSAVLLVPFDARNIRQKLGLFLDGNKVRMLTLFSEPGDSGGLFVGRDGVVGINFALTGDGKVSHFVPISVFESLYGSFINEKKAPV